MSDPQYVLAAVLVLMVSGAQASQTMRCARDNPGIRTSAEVATIEIDNGPAKGVVLMSGDESDAANCPAHSGTGPPIRSNSTAAISSKTLGTQSPTYPFALNLAALAPLLDRRPLESRTPDGSTA